MLSIHETPTMGVGEGEGMKKKREKGPERQEGGKYVYVSLSQNNLGR